jgi:hypothetical protein
MDVLDFCRCDDVVYATPSSVDERLHRDGCNIRVWAIIFSQRAIFFAPMDEIGTPRQYAGSAMAFGCIIGYMPAMFAYTLYGWILDNFKGITGYNYVFSVMIAFSLKDLSVRHCW